MASDSRFYQLELRHRPAVYGDLGNLIKIEGIVVGGEGANAILLLPDSSVQVPGVASHIWKLTMEEWTDFLARTDSPEILIGPAKAFHRKVRYEISGAVQQKIWVADAMYCRYCGVAMGKAQLTIDHFVPLEMGGKNDTSNFISACRSCNKAKGAMDPRDWCDMRKLNYEDYVQYLATRKIP